MDKKHISIHEHELATKARALIRDFDLRILPVTDEDMKLLGKVSRRDVLAISSSVSHIRVEGIMTPAKHIATEEDEAYSTIKQMLKVDAWYAPVVSSHNKKIYKGVLGLENFIQKQLAKLENHLRRLFPCSTKIRKIPNTLMNIVNKSLQNKFRNANKSSQSEVFTKHKNQKHSC